MENASKNLEQMAKQIRDTLTDFMLNHSVIEPPRYEEVAFFTPEGDRSYAYLDVAGQKLQTDLSKRYAEYYSKVQALLKGQPDDVSKKMAKHHEVITRTIEHKITWCEDTQQALDLALAALDDQLKLAKDISQR